MRLHHVQVSCPAGVEEPFRPARKAHPAFVVRREQLDAFADRLADAGYPVVWHDDLSGYRRFHTADGSGNRVETLAGP